MGYIGFGGDNKRHVRALGQRQFKPAGAVGVAAAGLAARLLDRMRDVLAPFRLRMICAGVGKDAQLAVRSRREREAGPRFGGSRGDEALTCLCFFS